MTDQEVYQERDMDNLSDREADIITQMEYDGYKDFYPDRTE